MLWKLCCYLLGKVYCSPSNNSEFSSKPLNLLFSSQLFCWIGRNLFHLKSRCILQEQSWHFSYFHSSSPNSPLESLTKQLTTHTQFHAFLKHLSRLSLSRTQLFLPSLIPSTAIDIIGLFLSSLSSHIDTCTKFSCLNIWNVYYEMWCLWLLIFGLPMFFL